MVNILVVTHGELADAFKSALAMFFGSAADTISTCGLYPSDSPEGLKDRIGEDIEKIDDGSGVMILTDIPNATPFNQTAIAMAELDGVHKIECLSGVSMPLLMEATAARETQTLEEMKKHLLEDVSPNVVQDLRKVLDM